MSIATARAGANVALVKYWGKRDEARNLPAVGSISVTLDGLLATAQVSTADGGPRFVHDGRAVEGTAGARMAAFLDELALELDAPGRLSAVVEANFPAAAGLASSAAIFCAVAAAGASLCKTRISLQALSVIARRGSGSAARSVFGGFVEWRRGERPDGTDSDAVGLLDAEAWPLCLAIAVTREGPKDVASRDAMRHVAESSPLYAGWIEAQEGDLADMRTAIARRDFTRLGTIAEENCLRMHATCLAARPPVLYWSPATLGVITAVRALRAAGTEAYFTIDAGPQVKVLCAPRDRAAVSEHIAQVPGVLRLLGSGIGPGVEILEGEVPWR